MQALQLKIMTPLGVVFDQEVDQVTVTTTSGEITILRDHIPLVTTLATGQVMVRNNEETSYFTVTGGVLEKRHDNTVVILSSRSESAQDIDLQRAQEAYENAQKLMEEAQNNPEVMDYSNLQKVMNKEFNRVRIGQKGMRR
jgi:F-type H+-transporting ATPase subunit epsilon